MQCVPILFPDVTVLWYCTGVLIAIGRIYFLCSGHSGIVVLFILVFVYFTLFSTDGGIAWMGLGGF